MVTCCALWIVVVGLGRWLLIVLRRVWCVWRMRLARRVGRRRRRVRGCLCGSVGMARCMGLIRGVVRWSSWSRVVLGRCVWRLRVTRRVWRFLVLGRWRRGDGLLAQRLRGTLEGATPAAPPAVRRGEPPSRIPLGGRRWFLPLGSGDKRKLYKCWCLILGVEVQLHVLDCDDHA